MTQLPSAIETREPYGRTLASVIISEGAVTVAILINTAALIVLGFTQAQGVGLIGGEVHAVAWAIDYACILYFVLEAALKIGRFGWAEYWEGGWNRFDFIVVLVSFPGLLEPLLPQVHAWSALFALRTGRLLRFVRLLRIIPNADHIFAGVGRALRASVGVFACLVILNLILALFASMLFGTLDSPTARLAFGDPLAAFYTVFKVFTIEGWYDVPERIAAETADGSWGAMVKVYFMVAVVVGGILGLSIANAVFIDEMVADNNDALEAEVHKLREEVTRSAAERDELEQVLREVREHLRDG